MTEKEMFELALAGARLFAAEHPRPSQVNATQAAEMLSLCSKTVRKMIKDGRLSVNKCGLIPIVEVDRCLLSRR